MTHIAEVVDLFCGIGGLSHGFKKAGFKIIKGFDVDPSCKFPFEANNEAEMILGDVSTLTGADVARLYSGTLPRVLAGCAPCQPFSKYTLRYGDDPRWNLVGRFADIAVDSCVEFVTMENVPQLLKHKDGIVFDYLQSRLKNAGYSVWFNVENAAYYGVAQNRQRLVFLAKKGSQIVFPKRSATRLTVRDAIAMLPKIDAGECHPDDIMHRSSRLSDLNLQRIRQSKQGGTWKDWPSDLVTQCHTKSSGKGYRSVYGRMFWDAPAPTMTTQCFGFGNGRFGHPEQDRAISLREAAIIQSFPMDYKFVQNESRIAMKQGGRWIGNAVPVKLALGIAQGISEAINVGIS